MQRINVSVFDTFFDIFAFKKHQGEGMNRDKFFINFNMIRIIPDKMCFTDCDSASKDSYCDISFFADLGCLQFSIRNWRCADRFRYLVLLLLRDE